jgi:hypothetical protein
MEKDKPGERRRLLQGGRTDVAPLATCNEFFSQYCNTNNNRRLNNTYETNRNAPFIILLTNLYLLFVKDIQ